MGSDIDTPNLIGMFVASYIASTLASISGIGGGGMLIPLYSIIGNIELKEAILLSIITIAGNSLVRSLYYIRAKHANVTNRYLPNFDIIRLVVPFDGNTAYLGFLLNQVLPNIVIFILIVIILGIMTYKTIQKTIGYFKNKDMKDGMLIIIDNIEATIPMTDTNNNNNGNEMRDGETKWDVIKNLAYSITGFSLITFFTFVRKTYDDDDGYGWAIYLVQLFIIGLFGYTTCEHIKSIYLLKKKEKFNFVEGDIDWSIKESFLKYIVSASFVGMFSTLLGIGGGMIMNPIMINFNVIPEVVVATSSITTFFSSVISALQFIISEGSVEWYYGVLFLIGGLASVTSLVILKFLRAHIKFVITCIMSVSLSVSLVLLVVFNIIKMVEEGVN